MAKEGAKRKKAATKTSTKTSTRRQQEATQGRQSGAKDASKKAIDPQRRKTNAEKTDEIKRRRLSGMRFELRPRIGMAPKPARRPHAAKNRAGAIGRNASLEPAAGALAHRGHLRCACSRVRQIGEAGFSLIPTPSISRFGNQSIGNGSAIAARCLIAEKRRERLISLCSLKAGQRVDIPKRLQSRRAHRLQPPCPRAQRKTPRRAKSGREGFSFDFSTHQRKRRRRRRLQRFSTHCFVFFSAHGV